jgi:type I restriction enzyme S subunit
MSNDVNEHWPEFALTDVFDIRSGLSKPASEFGTGFPFVTFKDVLDNIFLPETPGNLVRSTEVERSMCSVRRGDVFLTRTSETQEDLGMSSVALKDYGTATFNGFTKRLRPKNLKQIVPEYAAYFFRSPRFRREITAFSSLSTRASLNNDMLSRLRIPLPGIGMQESIGYTLKSLDDKIEQNRRTSRALEKFALAIFNAWFVDFEPVKVKAAGGTKFPGMPADAFANLPVGLVNSEPGPTPEGWSVRPLMQVAKLTMGQSPKSEFYNDNEQGLPFHQGVTDYGFRFPTPRVYCTAEGRLASAGDVLLSVRAPVGRINVADHQLILGRGLAGLRHNSNQQSFLLYQMRHVFADEDAIGDGTIYKAVNKDFLVRMPLLDPPVPLRTAFETVVAPMDNLIGVWENESRKLAQLRDYLLPRLLSGKVRVADAEKQVGAAT